jgi:hypothetical protein
MTTKKYTLRATLMASTLFLSLAMAGLSSSPVMAAEENKNDKSSNYVYLKPITLPVLLKGGISQFISVSITLEFDDSAAADKAHAIQPRLLDVYLQDLYGALDESKVMRNGVLDPNAIKIALEASNIKVLGAIPCRVLLQNLGQRSLEHS